MSSIASIPGYNISKVGKDRYAVSVNNGNVGAVLLNKDQVKQLADAYGVPTKKEKSITKKVLTGLAIAGGIALAVFGLKKKGVTLESLNRENLTKVYNAVKDKAVEVSKVVKEKGGEVYNKVAEKAGKVWEKVAPKKPEAVQLEIPFPDLEKTTVKFMDRIKNLFK